MSRSLICLLAPGAGTTVGPGGPTCLSARYIRVISYLTLKVGTPFNYTYSSRYPFMKDQPVFIIGPRLCRPL